MTLFLETVDAEGNIGFGVGEDVDIRIIEYDGAGNVVNIPSQNRSFTIYGQFTLQKSVEDDPDNPTGGRILLTYEELKIVYSSCKFALFDPANPSLNLWEGYIYRR